MRVRLMSGLTFESDTSKDAFRLSLEDWDDVLSMTGDASVEMHDPISSGQIPIMDMSAALTSCFPRDFLSSFAISSIITEPHTLLRCTTLDRLLLLVCCAVLAEIHDDLLSSVDRLKCFVGVLRLSKRAVSYDQKWYERSRGE